MDRLQKKCFIVSASLHGMLLVVLLFGSAFFVPKEEPRPFVQLHAFDPNLLTDALTHGGNPNVMVVPPSPPAPPAPPEPAHVETPRATPVPARPAETVRTVEKTRPDPVPVEPPKHKVVLSPDDLKPTKIKDTTSKTQKNTEQSDAQAREEARQYAAAQRQKSKAFSQAVQSIDNNFSTATTVELIGPGGGGPLEANYEDVIISKYYAAWSPPDISDEQDIKARITIARDGTVISGRITKRSGNNELDRSVQNALNTVTFIGPFPKGSDGNERTYTISFNPKIKH